MTIEKLLSVNVFQFGRGNGMSKEFRRWRFWASASSLNFSAKTQAYICWQAEPCYLIARLRTQFWINWIKSRFAARLVNHFCQACLASLFLGVSHVFLLHLSSYYYCCQSSNCCHVAEHITFLSISISILIWISASSIVAESAARIGVLHSVRETKWWEWEKKIFSVLWKTTGQALSSALDAQRTVSYRYSAKFCKRTLNFEQRGKE
jgi:hypothetical protein